MQAQEKKDKKMIDDGIKEGQTRLREGKYDEVQKIINRILPPIRRLQYRIYEINLLQALNSMKTEKWDDAKASAMNAIRIKPDDPIPWRIVVDSERKLASDEKYMVDIVKNALENSKPDKLLIEKIAPALIPIDNPDVTRQFVRMLESLPNYEEIKVGTLIPETPETLDVRLKLLMKQAISDEESCINLIYMLLDIPERMFETKDYLQYLPEDNKDRLYAETCIGPDPIRSAQKHLETTNQNTFRDFLIAAKDKNIPALKQEVNSIPQFYSGWIYLTHLIEDPKTKCIALQTAVSKFPQSVELLQLYAEALEKCGKEEESISIVRKINELDPKIGITMLIQSLIRNGKGNEAIEILNKTEGVTISAYERSVIDFLLYQQDHDKSRLKRIIEVDDDTLAEIKAEACYELREELGQDAEKIFATALKADRTNPKIYLYFARWKHELKDIAKTELLFTKAIEYGIVDPFAFDIVSQKYIRENKIEEALQLCIKIDTEWSHFRAGLIYQRISQHDLACAEFSKDLRINPDRIQSWQALGHSYIILGRIVSAKNVADELRQRGYPDLELEYLFNTISGNPIQPNELTAAEFRMDETPMLFFSYMKQVVERLRQYRRFGRKDASLEMLKNILPLTEFFVNKWPKLASAIKMCGDFAIEAFCMTNDVKYIQLAQKYYKQRAEVDRRAESFIDFAHAMQFAGNIDAAVLILRRVLKTFPNHSGLWLNLGIAFALSNKYPFARHCLCVSAKIATDTEASRAYACCAAVADVINDQNLLKIATDAARLYNPYDPDVWQLLAKKGEVPPLEAAKIAFEFGASEKIISSLPALYLRANKPLESLGYAMFANDTESIAAAYESVGQYDFALLFTKNEETQKRLRLLAGKSTEGFPLLDLYKNHDYEQAAKQFLAQDPIYGKLAAAICLNEAKKHEEALALLDEVQAEAPFLSIHIYRLKLKITPKSTKVDPQYSEKDPITFFMYKSRFGSRLDAAQSTVQKFKDNAFAMKLYILEALKLHDRTNIDATLYKIATELFKIDPNRDTLSLLLCVQIRSKEYISALESIQLLCSLCPNLISQCRPIMTALAEKAESLVL